LTSDRASEDLAIFVAQRHAVRSPRVLRTHLHAYARRIYGTAFRTRIGLCIFLPAHPAVTPLIRFLFVAPARCFRLPSDLQSPGEPLPSANTSPCRACGGLSPPSECALPGAQKNPGRVRRSRGSRDQVPGSDLLSRGQAHTTIGAGRFRSEEHTSELQSRENLVCRLL